MYGSKPDEMQALIDEYAFWRSIGQASEAFYEKHPSIGNNERFDEIDQTVERHQDRLLDAILSPSAFLEEVGAMRQSFLVEHGLIEVVVTFAHEYMVSNLKRAA